MAVSLKHTFVSAIPDGSDTSVVRPSNWNAEHTLTGTINTLMGFDATGASQSVTVGSGLTYSAGTITATGDGSGTVTSVAALTLGTSGTDLSSTVATGTTTPVITLNVPTASASNRGALSSADWTTFNNKGSGTVTSVTGTAPVVSSGGATPAISMAAATTSVNGYLTSTDWTTFNNKGSGSVTSVSGTGTVNGITLTGTVTTTGSLTLGGTLSNVSLTTQVTGTLPVANGGTGITSLGTGVATFLGTPSSANLAAAVTDETGSGALVFGTTPTFTTNITAPLHIGGTAVSSSLTLQSTSGVGSSDYVAFQTGSQSERMRITTGGNVGIGASVPGSKLTVSGGNINADQTTGTWIGFGTGTFTFRGAAQTDYGIGYNTNSGADFSTVLSGYSNVIFTANQTEKMRITSAGNVGIGTTTPTATLQVANASSDSLITSGSTYPLTLYTNNSSADSAIYWKATAGSLRFGTTTDGITTSGFAERMRITAAGNVGIGNSSPTNTLDVTGTLRVSGAVTFTTALTTANGGIGTSTGSLANCTVDGTNAVGYLTIPQNAQTGSYTLVLADSGKSIFHASAAGAATYTIPANSSVAYALGTTVTFINMSTNNVTIAITTDTLYLAGAGTTGSRTLAQYGVATATKMTSTTWIISGSGLT